MSDFNANDAYHVKMERLSRSTYIPVAKGKSLDLWFYERARGQYLVELSRQPSAAAKKQFKESILPSEIKVILSRGETIIIFKCVCQRAIYKL